MVQPSVPSATGAWKDLPVGVRWIIALVVAGVIMAVTFIVNNPDFLHRVTGNGFKTGDCATVASDGLSGEKMEQATCPAGTGSGTNPIYRVNQVRDGKDALCSGGFGVVTFSNEPENTTYCLIPVGLG